MHLTHMFNVQHFHHRNVGLVNFGLLRKLPRLPRYEGCETPTVELIGDFKHSSPLAVLAAINARDCTEVAMVTDAVAEPLAGLRMKPSWAAYTMQVAEDATAVVLPDVEDPSGVGGCRLCGSCQLLDEVGPARLLALALPTLPAAPDLLCCQSFRKLVQELEVPIAQAVEMCCTTPARIAKIQSPHGLGSLQVGGRADICLWNYALELQTTIVAGRICHVAPPKRPLAELRSRLDAAALA